MLTMLSGYYFTAQQHLLYWSIALSDELWRAIVSLQMPFWQRYFYINAVENSHEITRICVTKKIVFLECSGTKSVQKTILGFLLRWGVLA